MPAVSRVKRKPPAAATAPAPGSDDSLASQHDLYQCYGHSARVFDVAFHPTEGCARLASAADDQVVRLWSARGGSANYEQDAWCRGHTTSVLRAAWSPDAALLASGDSGGTVRIWEVPKDGEGNSAAEVLELSGHEEEVYYCEFLGAPGATSRHLLVGSSTRLFLWDVEAGALLSSGMPPPDSANDLAPAEMLPYIFGAALRPRTQQLAVCCSDGALRMWDVGQQRVMLLEQYNLTSEMLTSCSWSPDGNYLALTCRGGSVVLLDVRKEEVVAVLETGRPCISCSFVTLQGTLWLAVVGGSDAAVRLYGFFSGPGVTERHIQVPGVYKAPLLTVSVAQDGTSFAAAGEAVPVESLGGTLNRKKRVLLSGLDLTSDMDALALGEEGDEGLFQELPMGEAPPIVPKPGAAGGAHANAEGCVPTVMELQQAPIFIWRPRNS